jgi:hypothetical protein
MAKVKAKVLCFVDNGLRNPGDVFEYNGAYNHHLEYLEGMANDASSRTSEMPPRRLRKGKTAEASVTE